MQDALEKGKLHLPGLPCSMVLSTIIGMYGWRYELNMWRQYCKDVFDYMVRYRHHPLRWKTYAVNGKLYPYFIHPYNQTWNNERIVEIPWIMAALKNAGQQRILEIGNVLAHYGWSRHRVIDKYEHGFCRGLVRADLLDYQPDQLFDLVISISTVEHVGWDDQVRQPEKVLLVPEKIKSLLAPGGTAMVTIPVGYNQYLDQAIAAGAFSFDQLVCLRRVSDLNEWAQTDLATVLQCQYGEPWKFATGLVLGVWQMPSLIADKA